METLFNVPAFVPPWRDYGAAGRHSNTPSLHLFRSCHPPTRSRIVFSCASFAVFLFSPQFSLSPLLGANRNTRFSTSASFSRATPPRRVSAFRWPGLLLVDPSRAAVLKRSHGPKVAGSLAYRTSLGAVTAVRTVPMTVVSWSEPVPLQRSVQTGCH